MSGVPRGPVGFLDALREGCLIGWARDAVDPGAVALIRVMRGVDLLAEGQADQPRQDGLPGFRIPLAELPSPEDLLEGRVRVRAFLPGRQAAVTLAMSAQMRADLEAAAGWEPTTAVRPGARGRGAEAGQPAASPMAAETPEPTEPAPPEPEPPQPELPEQEPPEPPAPVPVPAEPAAPAPLPPTPPPEALPSAPPPAAPPAPPPSLRAAPMAPRPASPAAPAPQATPPDTAPAMPERGPALPPVARDVPQALRRGIPLPPRPAPSSLRRAAEAGDRLDGAFVPPPAEPARPAEAAATVAPPSPPPEPAPAAPEPPRAAPPPPASAEPPPAPPPAAPPPTAAEPPSAPPRAPPRPAPEPPPRTLPERLARLAARAGPAGTGLLHLLLPARADVLAPQHGPALHGLEAELSAMPELAADTLPLRHAFAAAPMPLALWRHDGRRLSVEGGLALLRAMLAVLRARLPAEGAAIARADAIAARADLPALPRRDLPGPAAGAPAFLGIPVRETEPALTESIFFDLPPPRPLAGLPGLEAWASPGAPLPWRVVLLAQPGLGGSAHPSAPGWWLRWLVAECVLSEALESAPPAAALELRPGLVVTLFGPDQAASAGAEGATAGAMGGA